MVATRKNGAFIIDYKDYEFSSEEFVWIAFSILESKNYHGLLELMSIIEKPQKIMKILYLMNGMNIKLPKPKEFAKCLQAATYIYSDTLKNVNSKLVAKPKDIKTTLDISDDEEKEILDIFDEWVVYLHKNGYEVEDFLKINRNNTKKRIKNIKIGKKWKAKRY